MTTSDIWVCKKFTFIVLKQLFFSPPFKARTVPSYLRPRGIFRINIWWVGGGRVWTCQIHWGLLLSALRYTLPNLNQLSNLFLTTRNPIMFYYKFRRQLYISYLVLFTFFTEAIQNINVLKKWIVLKIESLLKMLGKN